MTPPAEKVLIPTADTAKVSPTVYPEPPSTIVGDSKL